FFFFFQAEDGIRDRNVTGVQTCALPISGSPTGTSWPSSVPEAQPAARATTAAIPAAARTAGRMRVRIMTVLLWGSASGMGSGYEIGRASCRERGGTAASAAAG